MAFLGIIGDISIIQDGEKFEVEWKIEFSSVSKEVYAHYESPTFDFKNESWCLGMYPNGWKNRGYMDFCLCRSVLTPLMKIEFSFSLKTVSGKKDSEKRYVKEFLDDFDSHSTDHFLSLSHFKDRQSHYLDSGYLTVSCTMKITNPTESEGESYLYCFESSVASSNTIFTTHFSGKHPRTEISGNFKI